ncbi:MAG: hypothetical protein JOS17DRAFT_749317, partial [Linnemannia elongata]
MLPSATTATTTTVIAASIFDLPPVLDQICEFISTEDINSCRLVCKDWASLFEVYRWRSIEFDTPSLDFGEKFYTFRGPSSLEAVRKNSARIWTLHIEPQELVQLLLLENDQGQGQGQVQGQYHCGDDNNGNFDRTLLLSNLQSLGIISCWPNYFSTDIDDINGIFKFVVRSSSRLQDLSFTNVYRTSQGFDFSLLSSFASHSTLTALHIGSLRTSDQRLVLAILKNTPPCLRRLTLGCLCQGLRKADRTLNAEATVMDSDKMYEWRRFESLRGLSVDCEWGACESWVHHPILRNAPHLKYLKTGCYVDIEHRDNDNTAFAGYRHTLEIASTVCPEIQHLHLQHGGQDPVLTAAELVRLIQAYPLGLKSLNFDIPESGQEDVMCALLKSSASILESVVIEYYLNIPPMSKETVTRMIKECPRLEELDLGCKCYTDSSVECLHVELEAFVDAQGKPYDNSRWPF